MSKSGFFWNDKRKHILADCQAEIQKHEFPEFEAPSNSLLWGLGGLDETCRECTNFIIMQRHVCTWNVHAHGCYTGFGPRDLTAHFPAFVHLRVTNLPGPDSIMRSDQGTTATCAHFSLAAHWLLTRPSGLCSGTTQHTPRVPVGPEPPHLSSVVFGLTVFRICLQHVV